LGGGRGTFASHTYTIPMKIDGYGILWMEKERLTTNNHKWNVSYIYIEDYMM
jgi:hypothetical protein